MNKMSLSDLFFELSNETRVEILNLLSTKPMRLTDISKSLDLPAQEISRQLSRLDKMSMVSRDSDGLYHITPYSLHVLALIPGFDFFYKHREYFTEHTLEKLPFTFINRIGELNQCSYQHDIMTILHKLEGTLQEAEQYIHIMLDQIVSHTMPILEEKVKTGVEFYFITNRNINPPPGVWNRFRVTPKELSDPQLLDTRFIDDVPLGLVLTEKEVGLISFKTAENDIDYTGFSSMDASAHSWAYDVFEYYWAQASDVWPDELLEKHKIS